MQSNKISFVLSIFILFSIGFSSCESKTEKMLEGRWRMVSMISNGFTIDARQLNDPLLHFKDNKQYFMLIDERVSKGDWKLDGMTLYLKSKDDDVETPLLIESLTEKELIYKNKNGKETVKVIYKREEGGEEEEYETE